jgi:hypothetical protein
MTAPNTTPARMPRWLIILLIAMAGLMLEVGYTRIVSFKLWYYYTYLVIGLSLLGIGSGGILVAIWRPLREATTERIVAVCSVFGAISIGAGYFAVARLPVDTVEIWRYNASSLKHLALLGGICLALFATFIAFGIIVAILLGRAGAAIGRIYFADLLGAGLGCLFAIPVIMWLGPPRLIMLAALVFAVVGLLTLPGWNDGIEHPDPDRAWMPRALTGVGALSAMVLLLLGSIDGLLPEVKVERWKDFPDESQWSAEYSEWGPVFRVDVMSPIMDAPNRVLMHNATWGSGIWDFDGDVSSLTRYDGDARALPFHIFGPDDPPDSNLIIGSAGGNEILASLYYGVDDIRGVELNPVTVSLLEGRYREISGDLQARPDVDIIVGDGRTYLARSDDEFDMVWFVAPDSYAASNPASSGGFVLSESYLYTTEMLQETLEHLSDRGMLVAQFGESTFQFSPNRTSRYIVTARHALEQMGVEDPSQHIIVATHLNELFDLSTIIVKRTPFTPEEIERYEAGIVDVARNDPVQRGPEAPGPFGEFSVHVTIHAPGREIPPDQLERASDGIDEARERVMMVHRLAAGDQAEVRALIDAYGKDISVVTDDKPFFWHFSSFGHVLSNLTDPIDIFSPDPEEVIGERVMLLLLAISALYAAIFLFAPFVTVREQWRSMPFKGNSGLYFACLGLGFMLYEITLIQRLVLFLGYPTLSLTVTLAAILIFTGIGALLSERVVHRSREAMPILLGVLALLTVFYHSGLDAMSATFLSQEMPVRIALVLVVLAPLGLVLGMFMPLGLGVVGRITSHQQEYVAWSWAVNGFFSVIGSVLTTILSMMIGFRSVLILAFGTYLVAVAAFVALKRRSEELAELGSEPDAPMDTAEERAVPEPV